MQRRSIASALSCSALRVAFARYALSAQAGRRASVCFFLPVFVYVFAQNGNKSKKVNSKIKSDKLKVKSK
ncbi:hypothetical protein HMPREF1580_00770 [Gardnerella vaginalis JCP8070]|nr:hypothetical protein HMPREF1580_00770 [Gardnerella vaginalis JCP8070]